MPVYHKNEVGEWHPMSSLSFKENDAWSALGQAHWKEPPWDLFFATPTVHYMQSSETAPLERVVLRAYLDGIDAVTPIDKAVPTIVVLDKDSIIGSRDPATAALATGDLSPYARVIFLNYGEVQGAGGDPNGEDGGIALQATSSVEFANYGFIRGGGGAGGQGGNTPGYDYLKNCSGWRYQTGIWPYRPGVGTGYLWHYSGTEKNVQILFNSSTALCIAPFNLNLTEYTCGGWTYYRGTQRFYHSGTGSRHFEVKRCQKITVATRTGQAGGYGEGYLQERTDGADIYDGPHQSIGGPGGDGGTWGQPGEDGEAGYDGAVGSAAGLGGDAVNGNTFVHWLHYGTWQGPTDGVYPS